MFSRIVGTGSYLPARVLTNAELATRIDTSDEWVRTRTGICSRHIAAPDEQTSDLALAAARQALAAAGIAGSEVDLIVVATTTPDMIFPSTACALQDKLGARGGPAFDVQAVCSGFVYALNVADLMVKSGAVRNALVVGAEIYSRILDWSDRGTCVLFGDGAGAVVLVPSATPGILSTHLHADGHYRNILSVPGTVANGVVSGTPFLHMDGTAVFKFAVKVLAEVAQEALAANHLTADAIDWLIPHQANIRIMDATLKKLGLPP
jgi:3-oxoacyl-[acyl-carrier-protein] synthase-3